ASRPRLLAALFMLGASAYAPGQVAPGQCGHDRWPVKTLTDKDSKRVNFKPADSTVAKLAGIPIHEIPYPEDRRIEPEELQVYRVPARLLEVRRERDSDLHLILADLDDANVRMIAEIPAPECAAGSGHEDAYRRARLVVLPLRPNAVIELVGVAFFDFLHDKRFDFLHDKRGEAKNGIELHPVLGVRVVD